MTSQRIRPAAAALFRKPPCRRTPRLYRTALRYKALPPRRLLPQLPFRLPSSEETQRVVAIFGHALPMQRAVFVFQRESGRVLNDHQSRGLAFERFQNRFVLAVFGIGRVDEND